MARVRSDLSFIGGSVAAPALRYIDDQSCGWTRRRQRGDFQFFDEAGKRITDAGRIARVKSLAIPPAYTDVWICPDPSGHLQATGMDARGRKQYRYHPEWTSVRDDVKYTRMLNFARALPKIRRRVKADLQSAGLGREKIIAAVVELLERTLIRVGNQKYARENRSFGLTTLRARHVTVLKEDIRLRFRGKSGVEHDVRITAPRLARLVRRCMELPGQELFQYVDARGEIHPVSSSDVNAYLKSACGEEFSAKDYRTWMGSVRAFELLQAEQVKGGTPHKSTVVGVIRDVARRLANTAAVCRKCYVHPRVIERYLDGGLPETRNFAAPRGLRASERRFLDFISRESA